MIIGEHNLIIGKKYAEVSNYSISTFVHFLQKNVFPLHSIISLLVYIELRSNGPPKDINTNKTSKIKI